MGNETSSSGAQSVSNRTPPPAPPQQAPQPMQQQPQERRNSAGALNAPGAYKMPGQPSRNGQRFYVTIPRGVRPGQHFRVLVNGEQLMVRCPDGMRPGDRLIVTSPRERPQQYVVQVPNGVRPGQQFPVQIQNQQIMVTCPNVSLTITYMRTNMFWFACEQLIKPDFCMNREFVQGNVSLSTFHEPNPRLSQLPQIIKCLRLETTSNVPFYLSWKTDIGEHYFRLLFQMA